MHNPVSQQKVGEPMVPIIPRRRERTTIVGHDHFRGSMPGKQVAQEVTDGLGLQRGDDRQR